jgi:hypothetical protein
MQEAMSLFVHVKSKIVVMKSRKAVKRRAELLKKVFKVVYVALFFNPLVVIPLCFFITPWFAWLTPLIVLVIVLIKPKVSLKLGVSNEVKEAVAGVLILLHIVITLFAIAFSIDKLWPNLYENIWQAIVWSWDLLSNNYWILVILFIILLVRLFRMSSKSVKKASRRSNSWILYWKIRLNSNQLEKLEIALLNRAYSLKIFKRYFKLVITKKSLINKERVEFNKDALAKHLRINLVFSFLETFSEMYNDEKNSKLFKDFLYELAAIVNSYADEIIEKSTEVSKAKKELMQKQQVDFTKRLLNSPVKDFVYSTNIETLTKKVKVSKQKEKEEKKREEIARKKEIASGNVIQLLNSDMRTYSDDLLKEFFNNLSLKKFEEKEIIVISKFKGVVWTNVLDDFFDIVCAIVNYTKDDELINVIHDSIEKLDQEVKQVGDANLTKVFEKKKRGIPHYFSAKKD